MIPGPGQCPPGRAVGSPLAWHRRPAVGLRKNPAGRQRPKALPVADMRILTDGWQTAGRPPDGRVPGYARRPRQSAGRPALRGERRRRSAGRRLARHGLHVGLPPRNARRPGGRLRLSWPSAPRRSKASRGRRLACQDIPHNPGTIYWKTPSRKGLLGGARARWSQGNEVVQGAATAARAPGPLKAGRKGYSGTGIFRVFCYGQTACGVLY